MSFLIYRYPKVSHQAIPPNEKEPLYPVTLVTTIDKRLHGMFSLCVKQWIAQLKIEAKPLLYCYYVMGCPFRGFQSKMPNHELINRIFGWNLSTAIPIRYPTHTVFFLLRRPMGSGKAGTFCCIVVSQRGIGKIWVFPR